MARQSPDRPPKLIVYSRSNCHLCAVAKAELEALQETVRFEIEVRDVDTDPAWIAAYGDEVPVGMIGDRKVFKYRVDPVALARAVRSRTDRSVG